MEGRVKVDSQSRRNPCYSLRDGKVSIVKSLKNCRRCDRKSE